MLQREELLLIVYFIVVILLLITFGIIFFITFQKRKNKLIYEKFEAEKRFEEELTQSKLEIQEQTLKNVGWELHDNIGQLLSVANMQLNILSRTIENPSKTPLLEIKEVVAQSLQEVRSLSKSLNNEVIDYTGLQASVKNELARFARLNVIKTELKISGSEVPIPQKDAIILFRILQEFFSNVIKHSKADNLEVEFLYTPNTLKIIALDNGIGYNAEDIEKSSGLLNMESRAELIGAGFDLNSSPGNGSSLILQYPIKLL
ncbi:histidine kinase [Antarcticibacterium sp. 1MA-6-2]|uniref:sensor histidine kinase n=1 Tax=Antarcticibacterium sp. 1MA-6-2 TaxID=2908210 RepID=UPI001F1FF4D7|nr:histidine kinase [Antarcticibacterium sp. 1MA-6-2]UJH91238.1 histidine kinase [Antarcticibacterium sp. 1MA-6-2]